MKFISEQSVSLYFFYDQIRVKCFWPKTKIYVALESQHHTYVHPIPFRSRRPPTNNSYLGAEMRKNARWQLWSRALITISIHQTVFI